MSAATALHDAKKAEEEVAAMAVKAIEHPGVGKRQAMGKEAGIRTPVLVHSGWRPADDRPDPERRLLFDLNDSTRPCPGRLSTT